VLNKIRVSIPVLAALALLFGAGCSHALESPRVFRGVLVLEGKIVPGDYARLRSFLSDKATFDKISGGVFLASPGGSVAEAMNIGRLIRALALGTEAPPGQATIRKLDGTTIWAADLTDPKNYGCASACFLVFVSGIYRNENWAGRLGVHKPSRPQSDLKPGSEDPIIDIGVRHALENYLREMDVPTKYVDLMFNVPPSRMRWINQRELDTDLHGLIPELKDIVDAKCNSSWQAATDKQKQDVAACRMDAEFQLRAELPAKAWPKVFGRQ
jgi:hypothetical protein